MKRLGIKLLFVSLCLVLAVMLVLPACAPEEEKPLKIGLLLPYTGYDPRNAPQMEAAARLALDEVGWEVAGRPIEVITEDDACDPTVGVDKAKKLVEHDQVDVILGSLFGNVVVAVAGYVQQAGVVFAPFICQSMETINVAPNHVVLPTGTLVGSTYYLGLYAYDEQGYRTATTVYQDYIAGEDFIGGFEEGFKERGGTIVQRQPVPLGTVDFAPYLTNLEEADCLAFWLAGTQGPFLQQYYEFNVKIPVIVVTYWAIEMETMAELGDQALGVAGSGYVSLWSDNPLNREFIDAMTEKLGTPPNAYMHSAYITTAECLEAIKASGGDTSPEKLIAAWRNVEIDTPMGVMALDEQGCGIGNLYVVEFAKEDGEYIWKPVKTYEQVPMRGPGE